MSQNPKPLPAHAAEMPPFRVGEHRVRPDLNRIDSPDGHVIVEPRIMHVLVCLASRPGDVLSRRLLLDTVWRQVVVKEEALTYAVSQLRRAFGDDPGAPAVIQTIRKGGYRLLPPVEPLLSPAIDTAPPSRADGGPCGTAPPAAAAGHRPPFRRFALIGLLAMAAAGGLLARLRAPRPAGPHLLRGRPFTTMLGNEIHPALSPDGGRVAFSWNRNGGADYRIHLKQDNAEALQTLGAADEQGFYPAWSPDGTSVAYVAVTPEGMSLSAVPAIGGPARRLSPPWRGIHGLDWSPSGETLVFAAMKDEDPIPQLHLLDLATLTTRPLTFPDPLSAGDSQPRFAPDGLRVAFIRGDQAGFQDIYCLDLADREPRRLTETLRVVNGLDWTPDGRAIVYAAAPTGKSQLWRLPLAGGQAEFLATGGRDCLHPSLGAAGGLVYEEEERETNIWECRLTPDEGARIAPIISSTLPDREGRLSPDGERVAFISERTGTQELWLAESDGGNPRRVTFLEGRFPTTLRWAPDGDAIALNIETDGYLQVHLLDPADGALRQLTRGEAHHRLGPWSRDGRWLYVSIGNGPVWRFIRVARSGDAAEQVITRGCLPLHESADGELYYYKLDDPGIWKTPLAGGDEVLVTPAGLMDGNLDLQVVAGDLYLTRRHAAGTWLLRFDPVACLTDTLAALPPSSGHHLSVSDDGRRFLFDKVERVQRDLILVSDIP